MSRSTSDSSDSATAAGAAADAGAVMHSRIGRHPRKRGWIARPASLHRGTITQLTNRPVLAPRDADVVDHLDMLCRVALSGADTGGAFTLVEERARRGACTPRHVHAREAETFVVLGGALEGWCDGTATLVEAGSMIYLPVGLEHAFRIVSETAHFYTLITPAGFESFFAATGRRAGVAFDGAPSRGGATRGRVPAAAGSRPAGRHRHRPTAVHPLTASPDPRGSQSSQSSTRSAVEEGQKRITNWLCPC
jgi:quercetin dioxygenase-like cupin family protein